MNPNNNTRRVVVTGMGVVSPIGVGVSNFWDGLVHGRTNVRRIDWLDTSDLDCKIAAPCSDYIPSDHFDSKDQRRLGRFVQFAMVAGREAWKDAGLKIEDENPWRVGCYLGCGIGGMDVIEEQVLVMHAKGAKRVSPFLIPKVIPNMTTGSLAIEFGIKGPNAALVSACASGGHALGDAMRLIQHGAADVMLSGGAEAALCRIGIAGFCSLKAVSGRNDDPSRASRPFDADRDGFVMGEGAAVLVLEELERARARGATIYAEIAGYGSTDDAYHITAPDAQGEGGAMAMRLALEDAGLRPEDVQHINAHGTSTPLNDKIETMAIKQVFGEHARSLAISSNKSMIGHLLGAAAAAEAVSTVMTLREGVVPPTINYETPDPECDLDYVPNESRRVAVRAALSNSLGFGGHNATLAFRAWNGQ